MKQTIVITVIVLVLVGLSVLLFLNANTPQEDLPPTGDAFEILGSQHISTGSEHEEYISNPPTSGSHYAEPAAWGIYDEPLRDEQVIHNLEHGGIWISYKDIDEDTIIALENIANRNRGSVILSPRSANDASIALASWGWMENLDELDEDKIRLFIKSNKNKSPELLAR